MKAAILDRPGNINVGDYDDPTLSEGEILVKTGMTGVCYTDVLAFKGIAKDYSFPVILGHEITGIVEEINGTPDGYREGDKVCLYPITSCGKCKYCTKGVDKYCTQIKGLGHDLNGGFAEYVKVPSSLVWKGGVLKVSSRIGFEEAVFAEPLACCINCVQQSNISLDDDVVISGAGPTGLLIAQLCRLMGANVIVSEPSEERRKIAGSVGIYETINPIEEDLVAHVKEIWPDGANKVIVATGNPNAIAQAQNLIGKRGTISIFGLSNTSLEINLDLMHFSGYNIRAPWGLSLDQFQKAVDLINKQKLILEPLITQKYPLDETMNAINTVDKQIGLKTIIIPDN